MSSVLQGREWNATCTRKCGGLRGEFMDQTCIKSVAGTQLSIRDSHRLYMYHNQFTIFLRDVSNELNICDTLNFTFTYEL